MGESFGDNKVTIKKNPAASGPDSRMIGKETVASSDNVASRKTSLIVWSLFIIAVLEGVVLFFRE